MCVCVCVSERERERRESLAYQWETSTSVSIFFYPCFTSRPVLTFSFYVTGTASKKYAVSSPAWGGGKDCPVSDGASQSQTCNTGPCNDAAYIAQYESLMAAFHQQDQLLAFGFYEQGQYQQRAFALTSKLPKNYFPAAPPKPLVLPKVTCEQKSPNLVTCDNSDPFLKYGLALAGPQFPCCPKYDPVKGMGGCFTDKDAGT